MDLAMPAAPETTVPDLSKTRHTRPAERDERNEAIPARPRVTMLC